MKGMGTTRVKSVMCGKKYKLDIKCREVYRMTKKKKRKKSNTKSLKEKITSDENIERMLYIVIAHPLISFFIYITNDYSISFSRFLFTFESFMGCGALCGFGLYYVFNKDVSAKFWIKSSLIILFIFALVIGIATELTSSTGINFTKYILIPNK